MKTRKLLKRIQAFFSLKEKKLKKRRDKLKKLLRKLNARERKLRRELKKEKRRQRRRLLKNELKVIRGQRRRAEALLAQASRQ